MKFFSHKTLLATLVLAGASLQMLGCKPKGPQAAISGDAALKTYVAPGKYDEFYDFV